MEHLVLEVARTERPVSDEEVTRLRRIVAETGFVPDRNVRPPAWAVGSIVGDRVLQQGDQVATGEDHYLKHVLRPNHEQWSSGTTLDEYLDCLRHVILDSGSGVFLSRYQPRNVWQVGFIGPSGRFRGFRGSDWILVEYRVSIGRWVTGFQPPDGLDNVTNNANRSDVEWLREPPP